MGAPLPGAPLAGPGRARAALHGLRLLEGREARVGPAFGHELRVRALLQDHAVLDLKCGADADIETKSIFSEVQPFLKLFLFTF